MNTRKYIQIEFADPSIRAIDHIQYIRDAAHSAGMNLFSRYDVQLDYPMPYGDRVIVEIRIPVEIADGFAVGNHLRGMSDYLLKRSPDIYKDKQVGKRLLNYVEVSDPNMSSEMTDFDSLDLMIAFAALLKKRDDLSLDKIRTIASVLNNS